MHQGELDTIAIERPEEEDKLERFFCNLHEFHNPVLNPPVLVPELPARYVINFVSAVTPVDSSVIASPVIASPVIASPSVSVSFVPVIVSSSDYSVVSSVNFAPACTETKP